MPETGRVIGVVSEADLLPKEEFRDSDPSLFEQRRRLSDVAKAGAVTAEELMSTPAITVHPDATLAQAARIMAVRHVKRLPVVDDIGMLRRRWSGTPCRTASSAAQSTASRLATNPSTPTTRGIVTGPCLFSSGPRTSGPLLRSACAAEGIAVLLE